MRVALVSLACLLAVSGCSGSSRPSASGLQPSAPGTTQPEAPSTSPTPPTQPTQTAAAAGCPAKGTGIPGGAVTGRPLDVDGDGRLDTVWATGGGGKLVAGISTASGATSRVSQEFAGGVSPYLLAANADQRGTIVVLVGNNRGQALYRWLDCRIQPVLNPDGDQYTFDAGFSGNGTGIGCSRLAGAAHRDLVGLLIEGDYNAPQRTVKRTQIVIDGLHAHNGLVDHVTVQHGSQAETSAQTVSCGDLTPEDGGALLPDG